MSICGLLMAMMSYVTLGTHFTVLCHIAHKHSTQTHTHICTYVHTTHTTVSYMCGVTQQWVEWVGWVVWAGKSGVWGLSGRRGSEWDLVEWHRQSGVRGLSGAMGLSGQRGTEWDWVEWGAWVSCFQHTSTQYTNQHAVSFSWLYPSLASWGCRSLQ